MSTGTLENTGTRSRPTRATDAGSRTTGRSSTAASRPRPASTPARPTRARTEEARAAGTAPFVLLIMVLLTGGLVATLWLSTAAAADSYRLDSARQVARDLSEQTERLHRDVEASRSAPALAAAAQREGMVPAGEPAVLLVAPNGSSRLIGVPRPARPAPAPAVPTAPAAQTAQTAQTAPAASVVPPRTATDPEAATQTGDDTPVGVTR